MPWSNRETILRNHQRKEQQGRVKAARKLLQNANCGEITLNKKTVKVRAAACGMLYGMGKDKTLRINPLDLQLSTAQNAGAEVAVE